ncbi:MAG TPA: hypothetical protein VJ867_13420 [Gemmatimonadaceae bacterium]|nr:hypothetical protein [Gemmatimonadaceae bacterium]
MATSLAAALAVVVSAGYWLARPRRLVMPSEVETLSAWTSPTDALLRGARMHLITQAPRLGASMVDTLRGELR